MALVKPPESLKKFARICKIASDHEVSDPVITYYCRLYVVSMGLKSQTRPKDSTDFISGMLDYLAEAKSQNSQNELYTEEAKGLDYVEQVALELFTDAFRRDEAGDFGAATVTAFVNSGYLLEVLTLNGETSEELVNARKYAKFKAVHIIDCKKRGVRPTPGPLTEGDASAAPNISGLSEASPKSSPVKSPNQQPAPPAEPSPKDDSSNGSAKLSTDVCDKAIKSAKYAISSLQYKDRDSAIKFLKEALDALSTR